MPDIYILGGGIAGFSAATCLQLLGLNTEVLTDYVPYETGWRADVPTSVCAAILYPDKLPNANSFETVKLSSEAFAKLTKGNFLKGISNVRHYVLSRGMNTPLQDYPSLNPGLIKIEDDPFFNSNSQILELSGYSFQTMIAEMQVYFPSLVSQYQRLGGKIQKKRISSEEILSLKNFPIVNCLGIGSMTVFPELGQIGKAVRGSLLKVPNMPLLFNDRAERISYQFYPGVDQYGDNNFQAISCYCYPGTDGFVLGGSRESGEFNGNNFTPAWEFPNRIEVQDHSLPEPIWSANKELLSTLWNIDISLSDCISTYGLRYVIEEEEGGLRIAETDPRTGDNLYHCIGLGASGVTYSWGIALMLARRLLEAGILTNNSWSKLPADSFGEFLVSAVSSRN